MPWLKLRQERPVHSCIVHSRDLSHLHSPTINKPFLSYLSSGYEPGSQALFIIPRAYFRQCAHVSIVGCRAPRMMVMGYKTHHFQSNHLISWYLPSYTPYSQSTEPISGNAHIFLSLSVGHRGWWWWATMRFCFKMMDELHKDWGSTK